MSVDRRLDSPLAALGTRGGRHFIDTTAFRHLLNFGAQQRIFTVSGQFGFIIRQGNATCGTTDRLAVFIRQFQADNGLGLAISHHGFIGGFKTGACRIDGRSGHQDLGFYPLRGIALRIIGHTGQAVGIVAFRLIRWQGQQVMSAAAHCFCGQTVCRCPCSCGFQLTAPTHQITGVPNDIFQLMLGADCNIQRNNGPATSDNPGFHHQADQNFLAIFQHNLVITIDQIIAPALQGALEGHGIGINLF
ncbi:hypothetical protein Xmau_04569 [Xenorhabdus mauleonii]|uniref:Uncharacterized protein n=1 Tax=Xenorhabdus mauleonii TaxID=351675 RepID=A0A2G0N939_9GAMM|nr:hypothetical protein Xmau_04569 [Xenorhabdus mauleonii]